MKITKKEFINKVAEKTGLTKKDTRSTLDAALDTIQETLAEGDAVGFTGFGAFDVKERAAREGRNPQTGKPMHIPAKNIPVFRPGKNLRDAVLD